MNAAEQQRWAIHPITPQARLMDAAAQRLQRGGLALCPTDAGYALVWSLNGVAAEERVRRLRQLDSRHPFTLLCASISQAGQLARLDDSAFRLLRRLSPGPVTFILPASSQLPNRLKNAGRSKRRDIGIRLPDHPVAQALLAAAGEPLLSATVRLPEADAEDEAWAGLEADTVAERWLHGVDVMLDAGDCPPGPTSIVDCTDDTASVVRQGFKPLDL
jgi:tRNA threonylcarbamoyl adenosine modification protein (Sua5/YciO/YrdC/YwlC family)